MALCARERRAARRGHVQFNSGNARTGSKGSDAYTYACGSAINAGPSRHAGRRSCNYATLAVADTASYVPVDVGYVWAQAHAVRYRGARALQHSQCTSGQLAKLEYVTANRGCIDSTRLTG